MGVTYQPGDKNHPVLLQPNTNINREDSQGNYKNIGRVLNVPQKQYKFNAQPKPFDNYGKKDSPFVGPHDVNPDNAPQPIKVVDGAKPKPGLPLHNPGQNLRTPATFEINPHGGGVLHKYTPSVFNDSTEEARPSHLPKRTYALVDSQGNVLNPDHQLENTPIQSPRLPQPKGPEKLGHYTPKPIGAPQGRLARINAGGPGVVINPHSIEQADANVNIPVGGQVINTPDTMKVISHTISKAPNAANPLPENFQKVRLTDPVTGKTITRYQDLQAMRDFNKLPQALKQAAFDNLDTSSSANIISRSIERPAKRVGPRPLGHGAGANDYNDPSFVPHFDEVPSMSGQNGRVSIRHNPDGTPLRTTAFRSDVANIGQPMVQVHNQSPINQQKDTMFIGAQPIPSPLHPSNIQPPVGQNPVPPSSTTHVRPPVTTIVPPNPNPVPPGPGPSIRVKPPVGPGPNPVPPGPGPRITPPVGPTPPPGPDRVPPISTEHVHKGKVVVNTNLNG